LGFILEDLEQEKVKKSNDWLRPVLFFYGKVTGWVVGPLILALVARRMFWPESEVTILLIVGFLITIYGIYTEIKKYKKQIDGE